MYETRVFNQAMWDTFYAAMSESGIEIPNINEVVPTILAQNAEVLEQIWSKFEEGKYPVVILDDRLMFDAYMKDMIPIYQEQFPELTEEQIRDMLLIDLPKKSILGIPALSMVPISEDIMVRVLNFKIYSSIYNPHDYRTGGEIMVLLDDVSDEIPAGSMEFALRPNTDLYFPQDGATLSSEQMASNAYEFSDFVVREEPQINLMECFTPSLVDAEGEATAQRAPFFITADFYNKKFKYFDGLSLKEAVIASNGSVTVTTLGSLTAPTA